MHVELTQQFLADMAGLQPGLNRRCRDLLKLLRDSPANEFSERASYGWRLKRLHQSPFVTFRLDRNFRELVRLQGDTAFVHRAVKHELYENARVNRNESAPTGYNVASETLRQSDVRGALAALGLSEQSVSEFARVQSEDALIEALGQVDQHIAELALAAY